jgi:hypothetical protein
MFPFVVLLFSMLILHRFEKMQVGDDFWYKKYTSEYSLFGYVAWRYLTWTGRTTVEAVLYFTFKDNGFMWKIINPFIITSICYSISRIVLGKKESQSKNTYIMNWYICFIWFFISNAVLENSVFWITGSVNYVWTLAAGLIAIIPFRDKLMNDKSSKFRVAYLICAVFAAFGEEQVSLILASFATLINIVLFVRSKKVDKMLLVENLIIIIGMFTLLLAPGNFVRDHAEINNWLPNQPYYSKWEIFYYGIQWLLNYLLNDCRVIFLILIGVLIMAAYKKNGGLKKHYEIIILGLGFILITISLMVSNSIKLPINYNVINHIYNYNNLVWNKLSPVLFNFYTPLALKNISVIKFFLWPIIICLIPVFILFIYKYKFESIFVCLIYIAGLCSAMIMFLSPTIYASGQRTLYVFMSMIMIVIICIIKRAKLFLKYRYLCIFLVLCALKYIYFIHYLIKIPY